MLIGLALWTACTPTPPPSPSPEEPKRMEPPAPRVGVIGGVPILEDPIIMGGMERAAADSAIDQKRSVLTACWEAQRKQNARLQGKVLFKLVVSGDGIVRRTSVKSTSLRSPEAEKCMMTALKSTTFPKLKGGGIAILTYPFQFPPTS